MTEMPLETLWVYLAARPLFWLTLTLLVWLGARRLQAWCGGLALLNPVVLSIATLIGLLVLTDTPYAQYFDGAQFIHFLLGPATVALAIPLYRLRAELHVLALPITVALVVGAVVAVVSAVGLAAALGADRAVLLSLAPKSVTTPVAMGIAEKLGGIPALTAALVVLTGLVGALFGVGVLRRLGIRDPAVIGVALGTAAHGIGTARAFQLGHREGAMAGLAMGLSAVLTALLLPLLPRGLALLGM
ncbi:LrgB family protein [Marichromatium gracile]|uniref:Putative murein hydrolase (TIGR00659 family) n=2 Tax=Chromatiaceae TaxID=1046 RepID=A0A4R4A8I8_MARGR|nr:MULTISPECIES: LrgB family protein [Marichromatium]MCF1184816.1 LrgB family protein [Marichromatium gracile]TCW35202.1 putative murein hydrolase (TIGR00659 family) [Marichromatium gracile]